MPDYKKAARRAARKYGVDEHVFLNMIRQESGFQPGVSSPKGAQGIAQFIPSTAKAYGVNLHDNRVTDDLEGAARYLRDNLKRTGGNYTKALSIYNSGKPEGYKSIAETANYVKSILSGVGHADAPGDSSSSSGPSSRTVTKTRTIPGVDNSDTRKALILSFLQRRHDPQALIGLASGLREAQDVPAAKASSTRTVKVKGRSSSSDAGTHGGTATFDGKPVASWIKPLLEYGREHGWKGTVTSGYRSDAEQKRIYDSGVRPAAKPKAYGGGGSNHSRTGFLQGAVDVSDAATLDRILRAKHSRLKFAGAKDPVHFSVPRGGSY